MALTFNKSNRSAFRNFLDAKYEMLTAASEVKTQPYYLCIDPSDICQLRCPTCPTGIENESLKNKDAVTTLYRTDRKKLSMELYDSVMDELGEKLFHVMFYNYGEPLLNPLLPQFIQKATDYGISSNLHTNLSLKMSDEYVDELLSSGINEISVSIDGFSQEAYELHRVGGDVELVRHNLAKLAKARDRLQLDTELIYKFLIFKHNEDEVELARAFANEIGVSFMAGDAFVHDQTWLPSHREGEQPYYSAEEMEAIFGSWEGAGRGDYFEHEVHPFWNVLPRDAGSDLPNACSWHYGYSVITAGGPVAPCCAVSKEKDDFGTIVPGETSFADIWRNPKFTKSRLAMAGNDDEGYEHISTVCSPCYYPKLVQHLFSDFDALVAQRFFDVFNETQEPEMYRAFTLLQPGVNETNKDHFLAHYEDTLGEGPYPPRQIRTQLSPLSGGEATEIIQSFGVLIRELGVDGSKVFDESRLSHTKNEIMSAIVQVLGGPSADEQKSFANEVAIILAFFQPGVGGTEVALDTQKNEGNTWRSEVEPEMKANAREILSRVQTTQA